MYGGTTVASPLTDEAADLARRTVEAAEQILGERLDYARVDQMRLADGTLAVSELEVTEPGLYLEVLPGNADAFADLVVDRRLRPTDGSPRRHARLPRPFARLGWTRDSMNRSRRPVTAVCCWPVVLTGAAVGGRDLLRRQAAVAREQIGKPLGEEALAADRTWKKKYGDRIDLLVLGDSIAAGLGADKPRQTLGARLARKLAKQDAAAPSGCTRLPRSVLGEQCPGRAARSPCRRRTPRTWRS